MPKDSSFHPGVSSPQQSRQNQKDHSTKSTESLTTSTQRVYVHLLLEPKSIYTNVVLKEKMFWLSNCEQPEKASKQANKQTEIE